MARRNADVSELLCRFNEGVEDAARCRGPNRSKKIRCDLEDRPVVDFVEDLAPRVQNRYLERTRRPSSELGDRRDVMSTGNRRMEGQSVGDNGHGHAGRLLAAVLTENTPHIALGVGKAAFRGILNGLGRDTDTVLEDRHAFVNQALGDHRMLDASDDVVDAASKPACRGPTIW